nr:hypothetical protein 1903_00055 [Aeromonas salmonicida subsp. salmonicida]
MKPPELWFALNGQLTLLAAYLGLLTTEQLCSYLYNGLTS